MYTCSLRYSISRLGLASVPDERSEATGSRAKRRQVTVQKKKGKWEQDAREKRIRRARSISQNRELGKRTKCKCTKKKERSGAFRS